MSPTRIVTRCFLSCDFPNNDELRLYNLVTDYLQSERLYALPASQRQLMTLILRKLLASPPSSEGWVFPSPVTGRPYHAGILRKRHLQPLAEKIGVPRLSWHWFRHSFRSWLDVIGTAPGQQKTLMRHADISTTMNVYGSGLMDNKRELLSKLHEYAVGVCGASASA